MAEFSDLLTKATSLATFSGEAGRVVGPVELRDLYLQAPAPERLRRVLGMNPQMPVEVLAELEASLATMLHPYTRDGRVQGGLRRLLGGQHVVHSLLVDLAPNLVRAAAVLGSDEVADLLSGWIGGEPLRYRVSAILVGVRLEEDLVMEDGKVKFTALPESSDELAEYLPAGSEFLFGSMPFTGATKISIACEASPALFGPDHDEKKFQRIWNFGLTDSDGLEEPSYGLSLVLDCYVGCLMWWYDCDDLRLFDPLWVPLGRAFDGALMDPTIHIALAKILQDDQLQNVSMVLKELSRAGRHESALVATQRWMRSKSWTKSQDESGSMSDTFIDLRVSLEALFGTSQQGEFRFGIPLRGAWYIGSDLEQRREVRDAFAEAYDLGSKAAHGRSVEATENHRRALVTAQRWTREGILKRLREGTVPEWKDMVLGG